MRSILVTYIGIFILALTFITATASPDSSGDNDLVLTSQHDDPPFPKCLPCLVCHCCSCSVYSLICLILCLCIIQAVAELIVPVARANTTRDIIYNLALFGTIISLRPPLMCLLSFLMLLYHSM
jgi:hypothetical protein